MAVFDRGNVVAVRFDPAEGHEIRRANRTALVLSTREFNRLDDVLVIPVTQGGDFSRFAGFAVSLTGADCKAQGIAPVNKLRMLDLAAGKAKKVERVPKAVVDDDHWSIDDAV